MHKSAIKIIFWLLCVHSLTLHTHEPRSNVNWSILIRAAAYMSSRPLHQRTVSTLAHSLIHTTQHWLRISVMNLWSVLKEPFHVQHEHEQFLVWPWTKFSCLFERRHIRIMSATRRCLCLWCMYCVCVIKCWLWATAMHRTQPASDFCYVSNIIRIIQIFLWFLCNMRE